METLVTTTLAAMRVLIFMSTTIIVAPDNSSLRGGCPPQGS